MMITCRRELEQVLADHADEIRRLGVERLGVFGSFRRDDVSDASDIDVFVVFQSGLKTYRNFVDLADLLESATGRRVDLVTPESLNSRMLRRILPDVEYVIPLAA